MLRELLRLKGISDNIKEMIIDQGKWKSFICEGEG